MKGKTFESLRDKLGPALASFSENVVVKSIQRGFMATIALLIIGGMATLLASPPGSAETASGIMLLWHNFATTFATPLSAISFATMDTLSIWTLIGITYVLATSLDQDPVSNIFGAGTLFFVFTYTPVDGGISARYFGSMGLFTAMVVAIVSVYMIKFLIDKNVTIHFPDSVPDMVARPFKALVPAVIIIIFGVCINGILGMFEMNFPTLIVAIFKPLVQFTDSFVGVLIIAFMVHFLWSLGIHGGAVVMPIAMPIMVRNAAENMEKISAGLEPTNIFTVGFYGAFIMPLIGMVIAMLIVGRSVHIRTVAKMGLVPMIFNITEPVGFGAPVVLNPPLAIGRIVAVIFSTTVGYFAMASGFFALPSFQVPMMIPGFAGLFLSTADWKTVVLWFIVTAVVTVIYIPFVKAYDYQLLKQEKQDEIEAAEAEKKNDMIAAGAQEV